MTDTARSSRRYSYTDYLTWPDDERWEIIDGTAYAMVPAPTTRHQTILQNLSGIFFNHFRGKPCRPFVAPTDVKLSESDVVQPDLFVCEPQRIGEKAIIGPPDLIVEITSPSSEARDRREKKALYERCAVPEYWIVSPNGFLEQYSLDQQNRYAMPVITSLNETLTSTRFPELSLAVNEIFEGLDTEGTAHRQ